MTGTERGVVWVEPPTGIILPNEIQVKTQAKKLSMEIEPQYIGTGAE